MKNAINYYYNLYPKNISYQNNIYFFECNFKNYIFEKSMQDIKEIDTMYNLNKELTNKKLLFHKIIINKDNSVVTFINNTPYILMQIDVNPNAIMKLSDIINISNNSIDIVKNNSYIRPNWIQLWEIKNDYIEEQINEVGRKYQKLSIYTNYYIGLAENAISYAYMAMQDKTVARMCVAHKRIKYNYKLYNLYHPLYLVEDYVIRDISEYIKSCFFNKIDPTNILKEYLSINYITYKEALLLYARLLYPSYFFDEYDEIINNNVPESRIEYLINMSGDYELFLLSTYNYLSSYYEKPFPVIDWIIKRGLI